MSASYLLRFDDICPTMNFSVWDEVEAVLIAEGVKPIVAIVPDNLDPELVVAPACRTFWDRVRAWQRLGWVIALHGHQHLLTATDSGIMGINDISEFAGVPRSEQEKKLEKALGIFKREGVTVHAWVAPAHSFDKTTIELLKAQGINTIVDGFSLHPFVDKLGTQWIPQQLWRFRKFPFGVWTVCFHHNKFKAQDITSFCRDVRRFKKNLANFDHILRRYSDRELSLLDGALWWLWSRVVHLKKRVKASRINLL